MGDIQKKLDELESKRGEQKIAQDKQFEENIKKLEEKTTTDAEKLAVLKYREAVRIAIEARRSALQNAIKNFRDGMEMLRVSRREAIKKAIATFQANLEAAKVKAKTDCAAKVAPATVQTNFRNALKNARDKFEVDRGAIEKRLDALKPLIDVRKSAFEKAQNDFRTAIQKAKKDFKAVMGAGGNGTSTASSS